MQESSDLQMILQKAKNGDMLAFEQLVLRHEKIVYHVALRMMSNAEDAQDLSQEIWIKIYRSLDRFDGMSAFSTWIYRIAVNACIDEMRKRKGKQSISMEEAAEKDDGIGLQIADEGVTPEESFMQKEAYQELLSAMEKLSPEHKAVLILRDVKGLSYEEIAEIMNLQEGTVKSRLFRARGNLREEILKIREQNKRSIR